jgi:hypothetical protein
LGGGAGGRAGGSSRWRPDPGPGDEDEEDNYDTWDPLNPKPNDMWVPLTEWKLPSIPYPVPSTKQTKHEKGWSHLQNEGRLRSAPAAPQPNTRYKSEKGEP